MTLLYSVESAQHLYILATFFTFKTLSHLLCDVAICYTISLCFTFSVIYFIISQFLFYAMSLHFTSIISPTRGKYFGRLSGLKKTPALDTVFTALNPLMSNLDYTWFNLLKPIRTFSFKLKKLKMASAFFRAASIH